MRAVRRAVGWTSWLIVATHLYLIVGASTDREGFLFLPGYLYEWLDDLVAPASCETSYDLQIWSTAGVAVLTLHLVAWPVFSLMRNMFSRSGLALDGWMRRIPGVVGWASWLLVSTVAVVLSYEAIYVALGGTLANYGRELPLELVGWFAGVGLLHLAVMQVVRRPQA